MLLEFLGVESGISSQAEIEDETSGFVIGGLVLNEEGHGRDCLFGFIVGRCDEEALR